HRGYDPAGRRRRVRGAAAHGELAMTEQRTAPRGFRQARCAGCGLTDSLCLCGAWPALPAVCDVSIVMPECEARAASNSGRLAQLWLTGGKCHVRAADGLRDPAQLLARPGTAIL